MPHMAPAPRHGSSLDVGRKSLCPPTAKRAPATQRQPAFSYSAQRPSRSCRLKAGSVRQFGEAPSDGVKFAESFLPRAPAPPQRRMGASSVTPCSVIAGTTIREQHLDNRVRLGRGVHRDERPPLRVLVPNFQRQCCKFHHLPFHERIGDADHFLLTFDSPTARRTDPNFCTGAK